MWVGKKEESGWWGWPWSVLFWGQGAGRGHSEIIELWSLFSPALQPPSLLALPSRSASRSLWSLRIDWWGLSARNWSRLVNCICQMRGNWELVRPEKGVWKTNGSPAWGDSFSWKVPLEPLELGAASVDHDLLYSQGRQEPHHSSLCDTVRRGPGTAVFLSLRTVLCRSFTKLELFLKWTQEKSQPLNEIKSDWSRVEGSSASTIELSPPATSHTLLPPRAHTPWYFLVP